MTLRLRAFLLAGAASVGFAGLMPARAAEVLLNPSEFVFIESDGYFTIINNSTEWYIYGFEVNDTDATNPKTTQPGWGATSSCSETCLIYENANNPPYLPLSDDVGPGQRSSLFTFSLPEGSLPTFFAATQNGVPSGPFTPTGSIPEPSTWAMLLLGFAGLGVVGYRHGANWLAP
jgi:hypothetical protein